VTARFDALHHERVRAGAGGRNRLILARDGHPHLAAGLPERGDDRGVRTAEREGDHGDTLRADEIELRLPRVVVVAGLAELHSVALGLAAQRFGVATKATRVATRHTRHEQVEAERPAGELAQLGELHANGVGRAVPSGEEAEPAGLRDGRREGRRGGTAAQGRQHDRVLELRERERQAPQAIRLTSAR
jgi:hypothetical protein